MCRQYINLHYAITSFTLTAFVFVWHSAKLCVATNVTNGQKPNMNSPFSHFRPTANEILDVLDDDSWPGYGDVNFMDVALMLTIESDARVNILAQWTTKLMQCLLH